MGSVWQDRAEQLLAKAKAGSLGQQALTEAFRDIVADPEMDLDLLARYAKRDELAGLIWHRLAEDLKANPLWAFLQVASPQAADEVLRLVMISWWITHWQTGSSWQPGRRVAFARRLRELLARPDVAELSPWGFYGHRDVSIADEFEAVEDTRGWFRLGGKVLMLTGEKRQAEPRANLLRLARIIGAELDWPWPPSILDDADM